jgi:hypothetical protein
MVDQDGRTLLFVEMCARVVKNNLRLRLRERMRYIRCPPPHSLPFPLCVGAGVGTCLTPALRFCDTKTLRKLKLPLEEPYHRLVIDYMNLVIGHNDQSEEYWAKNLKTSLVRYDATPHHTCCVSGER